MSNEGGDDEVRRKRDRAVSLQYKSAEELPVVTASGVGAIARQIVELAEQHGVPVQRDETLAELLGAVEVGESISAETYKLVAEVLSFLYHTDKEWREGRSFLEGVLAKVEAETEDE